MEVAALCCCAAAVSDEDAASLGTCAFSEDADFSSEVICAAADFSEVIFAADFSEVICACAADFFSEVIYLCGHSLTR